MALSRKQWLGVAREATAGTMQANPTLYLPTKGKFKNLKKRLYFTEDRNTRDGNNEVRDGSLHSEGDLQGAWYNDAAPYLLLAFMGTDTATQPNAGTAPTVYSHALTLADNPLPIDFWKGYDSFVYKMAYNVVKSIKFKWQAGESDKGLDYTATTLGQPFVKMTTGIPTPTFTSLAPFAGWMPTIQFSGAASTDIEEMEIDLEQKWTLWFPSNGSQNWVTAYPGERTAKLSFTARFDTDTLYQKYASGTGVDDHINVSFVGDLIAATYSQTLTLDFPIVGYDDMEHETGKDNVTIKGKATARPGTAVNSLFSATVQNTVASYAN